MDAKTKRITKTSVHGVQLTPFSTLPFNFPFFPHSLLPPSSPFLPPSLPLSLSPSLLHTQHAVGWH